MIKFAGILRENGVQKNFEEFFAKTFFVIYLFCKYKTEDYVLYKIEINNRSQEYHSW
jgi:hypothetical protein